MSTSLMCMSTSAILVDGHDEEVLKCCFFSSLPTFVCIMALRQSLLYRDHVMDQEMVAVMESWSH